jgi:hypothetical protein
VDKIAVTSGHITNLTLALLLALKNKEMSLGIQSIWPYRKLSLKSVAAFTEGYLLVAYGGHMYGLRCAARLALDPCVSGARLVPYSGAEGQSDEEVLSSFMHADKDFKCDAVHVRMWC